MADDPKLSVNNMVELAMGLSMASLFTGAMNNTFQNTSRMMNNNEVATPPRYIHAIVNGVQKGPYTLGEVAEMIKKGEVTMDTYMWKPGMPEWKLARDIDDIGPNFELTPPAAPNI